MTQTLFKKLIYTKKNNSKMKKRLQTFESFVMKLNETGEWSKDVDWNYVKDNPDAKDDCSLWIKALEDDLMKIKDMLSTNIKLEINSIRGFDMYQGPYAWITINNGKIQDKFKVWTMEDIELWIEDFPIDNTSDDNNNAGFRGLPIDIADVINDHFHS